jgi:hypothetical protein
MMEVYGDSGWKMIIGVLVRRRWWWWVMWWFRWWKEGEDHCVRVVVVVAFFSFFFLSFLVYEWWNIMCVSSSQCNSVYEIRIIIRIKFWNQCWLINFGRRLCELSVVYEWMRIFLFEFDLPLIWDYFYFVLVDFCFLSTKLIYLNLKTNKKWTLQLNIFLWFFE